MKQFKVRDKSGRKYGSTTMNQGELLRFMRAGDYEKQTISSMRVGQTYNENRGLSIKREKNKFPKKRK